VVLDHDAGGGQEDSKDGKKLRYKHKQRKSFSTEFTGFSRFAEKIVYLFFAVIASSTLP
jgi:hypothetical protein